MISMSERWLRRWLAAGSMLAVALMGCTATHTREPSESRAVASPLAVEARYTATPIVIDGKLDEPAWEAASSYSLRAMPGERPNRHPRLVEAGRFRMAWDDKYLYLAGEFQDSDAVAEGQENGLRQFNLGDVCELFVRPENQSWYWELHATPAGRQTTFFFPSSGRRLPGATDKENHLLVAAQIGGTLNNWQDRDEGWTVEMAVPLSLLTSQGDRFGPESAWRVLAARVNFSRYLSETELSSYPSVSKVNFHLTDEYAPLRLIKRP